MMIYIYTLLITYVVALVCYLGQVSLEIEILISRDFLV